MDNTINLITVTKDKKDNITKTDKVEYNFDDSINHLDLSHTDFSKIEFNDKLNDITSIDLSWNKLMTELPDFSKLPNLGVLNLMANNVTSLMSLEERYEIHQQFDTKL